MYDAFHPGQIWLDTEGKRIHAHGGSVIYIGMVKIKRKPQGTMISGHGV